MATFVRISALSWADVLAGYALFVMMTYLTNVWELSFTHAAAIINISGGLASILPIGFAILVDRFMGNFSMLLISSIAYSIGLGFLAMSTPPVIGSCSEYKSGCITHTQKALFYAALALISVGISGHVVSFKSFLEEQPEDRDSEVESKIFWQILGVLVVIFVPLIGAIALPYINPWSIRFGIPAICTVVATLLFMSGSCTCSYHYESPKGSSPLTTPLRVFVAASSKIFRKLPDDVEKLYKDDASDHSLPHTRGLRCLDKAAIISSAGTLDQQMENKWKLCTVTEVEETKISIRMVPMWVTFIVCGVILSIGNTYFIEQANHLDRKVGRLTVPVQVFLLLSDYVKKSLSPQFYNYLDGHSKRYAPPIGIALAMISSIVCCITAAKVETRRLNVIRDHGLVDKPDDKIPMSIFWLLPQFVFLAGLDGLSQKSMKGFFTNQVPPSMKKYLIYFTNGVFGLGTMASVLSVFVVGKVSETKGKSNWFQYALSKSHLDMYYWTLAAFGAVNLVCYISVASFYTYREADSNDEDAADDGANQGEGDDENNGKCCC